MKNAANRNIQPVERHTTIELLKVMRAATIAHDEALADARAFTDKIGQCADELARRVRPGNTLDAQGDTPEPDIPAPVAVEAPAPKPAGPKPKNYDLPKVNSMIQGGLELGLGLTGIARNLNDAGLTTVTGRSWSYMTVYTRVKDLEASAA